MDQAAEQTARMRQLADELNRAARAYYVLDDPYMSDKEYDALYDELSALEKETGVILPDSPTHRVGGEPLSEFLPHTHINRLWSMDKAQTEEQLSAWIDRTEKLAGRSDLSYFVEYKFDGLTLNLTYRDGQLVQAATRGNGVTGEAILPQARTIRTVPLTIPYRGLLEVQGECIMRLSALEKYNQSAKEPLKNARNAAAGALRNLDPQVTASRNLDAFFYQVGTIENPPYHSQPEMLDFLRENGFQVSPYLGRPHSREELLACIREIGSHRGDLDWLIDGAVIKVGDFALREQMGFTEKFPRWAVAYKFEAEEATTVLRRVTWELGRTGKLTPLAHLDPVDFYGVTVRRATLNNRADILRKRVALNAPVWIRRSNDVIPEITGRVGEPGPEETPIEVPEVCPACGARLVERGAHLFCLNRVSCKPQAVQRLAHFAGRDAMDIDGFSEKTAALFYDELGVRDPADLYSLTAEQLTGLEGFSAQKGQPGKKAQKLVAALDKSRHCPLDAFLFAIGIPNIGRKTARDLAQSFGSLRRVQEATAEQLTAIPDVGDIVAQSVTEFFSFDENLTMIDRLLAAGVTPSEMAAASGGVFSGMSIVVTGTLPTLSRKQAEELIRANGGTAASSVSKKTAFVVAGEAAGSKLTRAQALGIEVVDEAELLRRAGEAGAEPAAGPQREAVPADEAPAAEPLPEPAEPERLPGVAETVDAAPADGGLGFTRRTWIDIDLNRLKRNYFTARSLAKPGVKVTCVIKSNAYGHGAVRVAQALSQVGCDSFAVSCAREAFELRQSGITAELLVMGLVDEPDLDRALREGLTVTVADTEGLRRVDAHAAALGETAHVHLKLDTGFHRLGFPCTPEAAAELAGAALALRHTRIEALYSHLGLVNRELDEKQHAALLDMQLWLRFNGLDITDLHLCDSIGLVRYPEWHHSRVRVGAFLFGVRPSRTEQLPFRCEETLTFRTTVAQLHRVEKGGIVGYGDDMPLERDSLIATLCVGYGDGYPRSLSNAGGQVLIRGQRCPVVGLVCMDQLMVDVTDVPGVSEGDEVTLLGGGIGYGEYSEWCRTNRNECISILSRRPLRVYHENGRVVTVVDSLLNERRDLS